MSRYEQGADTEIMSRINRTDANYRPHGINADTEQSERRARKGARTPYNEMMPGLPDSINSTDPLYHCNNVTTDGSICNTVFRASQMRHEGHCPFCGRLVD